MRLQRFPERGRNIAGGREATTAKELEAEQGCGRSIGVLCSKLQQMKPHGQASFDCPSHAESENISHKTFKSISSPFKERSKAPRRDN